MLGGDVCLAAIAVPQERFDNVAEQVNAHPEIAHNYERNHALNMWFVVSAEDPRRIAQVIAEIEARNRPCGSCHAEGARILCRLPRGGVKMLDAIDRRIVAATQAGCRWCAQPYRAIAEKLGLDEAEVIARLRRLLGDGAIRRIGAIPNHYALGFTANGMSVWDVADGAVADIGAEDRRARFRDALLRASAPSAAVAL